MSVITTTEKASYDDAVAKTSNIDNTSDADKPISNDQQVVFDTKMESIVAGTGVSIDNTDPKNPIVSYSGSSVLDFMNKDSGTRFFVPYPRYSSISPSHVSQAFVPIVVYEDIVIDNIIGHCSTIGVSVSAIFGIYNMDKTGKPTTLVGQTNATAITVSGMQVIPTRIQLALPKGIYLLSHKLSGSDSLWYTCTVNGSKHSQILSKTGVDGTSQTDYYTSTSFNRTGTLAFDDMVDNPTDSFGKATVLDNTVIQMGIQVI